MESEFSHHEIEESKISHHDIVKDESVQFRGDENEFQTHEIEESDLSYHEVEVHKSSDFEAEEDELLLHETDVCELTHVTVEEIQSTPNEANECKPLDHETIAEKHQSLPREPEPETETETATETEVGVSEMSFHDAEEGQSQYFEVETIEVSFHQAEESDLSQHEVLECESAPHETEVITSGPHSGEESQSTSHVSEVSEISHHEPEENQSTLHEVEVEAVAEAETEVIGSAPLSAEESQSTSCVAEASEISHLEPEESQSTPHEVKVKVEAEVIGSAPYSAEESQSTFHVAETSQPRSQAENGESSHQSTEDNSRPSNGSKDNSSCTNCEIDQSHESTNRIVINDYGLNSEESRNQKQKQNQNQNQNQNEIECQITKDEDKALQSKMKQKSVEETSPNGNKGPRRSSITDRFEKARLEQQQKEEQRLNQIRKARETRETPEKVVSNVASDKMVSASNKDTEDRLRQYLSSTLKNPLAARPVDNETSPVGNSIKDRFEKAKRDQQIIEEARLNRIKGSRTSDVPHEGKSISNIWEGALTDMKATEQQRYQATKEVTISSFRVTDGTGFVKKQIGEWETMIMQAAATLEKIEWARTQAILKAKRYQQERMIKKRDQMGSDMWSLCQTESQFFYDLICNLVDECIPEEVEIGSVLIYNVADMSSVVRDSLKACMEDEVALLTGISLPVGVLNNSATSEILPVNVVAILLSDAENVFLAITIDLQDGHEACEVFSSSLKVAIFANEGEKEPSFLRTFLIVEHVSYVWSPSAGDHENGKEENEGSVVLSSSPSITQERTVETDSVFDQFTKTDLRSELELEHGTVEIESSRQEAQEETQQGDVSNRMEESVEDSTTNEITMNDNHSLNQTVTSTNSTEDDGEIILVSTEPALPEQDDHDEAEEQDKVQPIYDSSPINLDDESMDEGNDDPNNVFNFGRASSVAYVSQKLSKPIDSRRKSYSSKIKSMKEIGWSLEDERENDLPLAGEVKFKVNLINIVSLSSAFNCLVVQYRDSAVVFTGTLKHAVSNSKFVVIKDKIFEWYRGAAASGWMMKWPMKTQAFGRPSRRFFVLRDDLLTYHEDKPKTEEDLDVNSALSGLRITDDTVVRQGRHYLMKCLVIQNHLDTLWVRCGQNNVEEDKWVRAIGQSIDQIRRKTIFQTKARVECIWHHESPSFSCVAVDAVLSSSGQRYAHIALFKSFILEASPTPSRGGFFPSSRRPSTSSASSSSSATSFFRRPSFSLRFNEPVPKVEDNLQIQVEGASYRVMDTVYSVDLGSSDNERVELEVLNIIGSTNIKSELSCVKLFGEYVLMGGSNGYLGLGSIGINGKNPDNSPNRVLYMNRVSSTLFRASPLEDDASTASDMQRNHSPTSSITCIAVAVDLGIFAAGDNEGNLSLWEIENSAQRQPSTFLSPLAEDSPMKASQTRISLKPKDTICGANLLDFINISYCGKSNSARSEQIKMIQFLPSRQYCLIGTNERLLLLSLDRSSQGEVLASSLPSSVNRMDLPSHLTENDNLLTHKEEEQPKHSFFGYSELDKSIPGFQALYSVSISEDFKLLFTGSSTAEVTRKMVVWKIVHEEDADPDDCAVYRHEWTDEMLSLVLKKIKPIS